MSTAEAGWATIEEPFLIYFLHRLSPLLSEDASLLAFDTAVIHHRCPQKLIAFYETRLRFRPANRGATEASGSAPAAESAAGNGTDTQANGDAQAQAATTNGDGGAQTGAAEGAVTAPESNTQAEGMQAEAAPAVEGTGLTA